jgi:hypothetical protein
MGMSTRQEARALPYAINPVLTCLQSTAGLVTVFGGVWSAADIWWACAAVGALMVLDTSLSRIASAILDQK